MSKWTTFPSYYAIAIVSGGISYDSGTGDALTLVTAPANTVPIGVPLPFTVTALGTDPSAPPAESPLPTRLSSGNATLACGKTSCPVTATGDGTATMNVTAVDGTASVVTASLTNGSSLQAHFSGGTPPVLTALTPDALAGRGSHHHLDHPGPGAEQRRARQRASP